MNVKNNNIALLLAASAVSMALTGCGGSDGNEGNPGKPGGPAAEVVNVLNLDVTKVTYQNGLPTVTVFATNEEDLPVVGLKALEVKAVAQLIPQGTTGAGDSAQWQKIGSEKVFTDHKNGHYTFDVTLDGYNSELTQRYNVIASASTLQDGVTTVPHTELSQDFSGDGYQALYSKDIVATATCNSCHAEGEKIYHGYTSAETCASCHTQEWAEERGKPEVAFTHMIHNVHNSAKGYKADRTTGEFTKDAKKAHALLQDKCTTCHVAPAEDSDELSEWGNWSRVPTMETCTSCHVDIDFKAGQGHSQQADNSNCIACHNASWTEELHTDGFAQTKALIDTYGMNTNLVVNEDRTATVTVSLVDANGEAVNVTTLLPQIQRIEVITTVGPNNVQGGYYGHDSLNLVVNGVRNEAALITEEGNISYTTGLLPFPDDIAEGADTDTAFTFSGLSLCSEKGEFVNCDKVAIDGNLDEKGYLLDAYYTGMKAGLAFATLSGEAPSMRHVDSVNFNTCINCHGDSFEIHKGTKHPGFVMSEQLAQIVDGKTIVGVDGCVTCHTPDGTYSPGLNKGALEMKLHRTHSSKAYVISGDVDDYGVIKGLDCAQCHNDFNLDSFAVKSAMATSPSKYSTPIAATCGSCHDSGENYNSYKAHVETQGALYDVEKNVAVTTETCFYCHKPTPNDHTAVKM